MIPKIKVRDLISKHQKLEQELSSGNVEKKLFPRPSLHIIYETKKDFSIKMHPI